MTHYEVPDSNSETWIVSKPRIHSKAMSEKNEECGPEFKRIVKMIKWWNHQHSSLLQSFHIEVMALTVFAGDLDDYPWNIFRYFEEAAKLAGSSLWQDNAEVDGYLSFGDRQQVIKRLATARDKAREAWYLTYGQNDDHEKAIEIWRQIFGSEFPAYGS